MKGLHELFMLIIGLGMLGVGASALADWEYKEGRDPFTDEVRAMASPPSDMYEHDAPLVIGIKCEYDGLNILINHKYLGGDRDDDIQVQMRVDDNERYGPRYWRLEADHRHAWMPLSDVPNLVEEMRNGIRLLIRVTDPLDGESITQAVSLRGFSAALKKLPCYSR